MEDDIYEEKLFNTAYLMEHNAKSGPGVYSFHILNEMRIAPLALCYCYISLAERSVEI